MADISTDIASWSATAGSNSPSGSTAIGTGLDDNLRAIQAAVVAALNAKGSDISSATTIDLSATNGLFHDVTGTTTITGLGTVRAGVWKVLKFEGALTFTHNATSLILPGGANITTADGDIAMVVSEGSGNWRCAFYIKKSSVPVVLGVASAAGDIWQASAANVMARLAIGTARQVPTVNAGATALAYANPITIATEQASTSGTAIDFTSIPAGVRRITVMIVGVSTNGTSVPILQIGDSGGIETTGYLGSASSMAVSVSSANFTTGFGIHDSWTADYVVHGSFTLVLEDATNFTWVCTGLFGHSETPYMGITGGSKSLSAVLDRIRLTTVNGTDAFDAGEINISYE